MTINFNQLAWEAPNHNGECGYIPTDDFYNDICEWLKNCKTIYQAKEKNKTIVRKMIENSPFDVIVTFNHSTKMISYYFKEHNVFEIL